ncbi:MAG: hypothetical protein R2774_14900 [Saprospiraceae bacterium]
MMVHVVIVQIVLCRQIVCISATPPVPDVNLTCEDGKKVTLHAAGTNLNCGGNSDINISIPNSAQVYQLVTEVVYKNHDPEIQLPFPLPTLPVPLH